MHLSYHLFHLYAASHSVGNAVYHQQHNSELFVALSGVVVVNVLLSVLTLENSVDVVLLTVGVEVIIVSGETCVNVVLLQILRDKSVINSDADLFVQLHHFRKVLPCTRCNYLLLVRVNKIVMLRVQFQISHDARMHACIVSILHPDRQNSFAVNSLETVPGSHIELNYRAVVLGRVTCCNDYPSGRYLVQTEDLVLQKLQHDRCK